MLDAGILTEDDRVELIEGEIIQMAPIGSRHAACVSRLNQLFSREVGERTIVSVQNPIRLGEHSEPEPDVTLLRPKPDFYASAHPTPADVLLVVEVADTSMEYDREVKIPLYARAGVSEVWLVDLTGNVVELFSGPSGDSYREVRRVAAGQTLSPAALTGLTIPVDQVLP
jgi:Uma2 family endonuclease